MNGFSLILPTIRAHRELDLCLKSIAQNSRLNNELIVIVDLEKKQKTNRPILGILKKRKIKPILNETNLGPYRSWNKGAKKAKQKILCFITDDQYFAPGWDEELLKYMKEDFIISGQVVEPGVVLPSFPTLLKDFGDKANNFREKEFLNYVNKIKKNKLVDGIFFIPLAIYKKKFFELGTFPTKGKFGKKSTPNDVLFIKHAMKKGSKHKTSLASISYHFQACSWEKHREIKKILNYLKLFLKKDIIIQKRIDKMWGKRGR